jgi:hypothetical protein
LRRGDRTRPDGLRSERPGEPGPEGGPDQAGPGWHERWPDGEQRSRIDFDDAPPPRVISRPAGQFDEAQTGDRGRILHWDLPDLPRTMLAVGLHVPGDATRLRMDLRGLLGPPEGPREDPVQPEGSPPGRPDGAGPPPDAGDNDAASRQFTPGEVFVALRQRDGQLFGQRLQLRDAWQTFELPFSELTAGPNSQPGRSFDPALVQSVLILVQQPRRAPLRLHGVELDNLAAE